MARARMGNGRRVLGGAMLVVLLVAAACSGDDEATPEPDGSDESVETGETAAPVRYQDVWVYERISTVDLDGEVVDLTPAILATADDLGDPIELAGDTEFLEWPGLEPYLIDGDGTTRDDVDAVAGIARQGDQQAIMVVGTPDTDDTPPIDEDDQVRIDLTAIEDQLQPGDPLVMEYTFAHTFGPDADDAPDTGVELFLHRAEQQRLRYAAGPDGGVGLATDLGQAYAGSVVGGTPAKAQPMMDGFRDGLGNCVGELPKDCLGDYFEDFGDGVEISLEDAIGDQVCAGDDCEDDDDGDDRRDDDDEQDATPPDPQPDDPAPDPQPADPDPDTDDPDTDDPDTADPDNGDPDTDDDKPARCFHNCPRPLPDPEDPAYCSHPEAEKCGNDESGNDAGSTDGDPHVHTFDGRHYLIQSVGEFVLATTDDWETQVRYVTRDEQRRYSLADVVATRLGGHTVVLDPSPEDEDGNPLPATATIDGEPVDVVRNGAVLEVDGLAFGHETGYLWVELAGVGSVGVGTLGYPRADIVVLDPDLEFEGLLGDRDGNPDNDLRLGPGGDVLVDPSQDDIHADFADAWRVTDETSLLPYGPGESTADYTDLGHPGEPIARAAEESGRQAQAETLCRIARVSEASMEACIIDYSVTGDVSWVTGSAISDRFRGFVRREPEVGGSSGTGAGGAPGTGTTVVVGDAVPLGGAGPGVTDGETLYQFVEDSGTDATVLLAIDVDSGTERWRVAGIDRRCGVGVLDPDAGLDGRIAAIRAADESRDAAFVVIDAETGEIAESTDWADAPSTYCTPLLVVEDRVLVVDALGDLTGWSIEGAPAISWETDDPVQIAAAAVTDGGRVLVQRRSGGAGYVSMLELVDVADGLVVDAAEIPGRVRDGSLAVDGERVVTVSGPTAEADNLSTIVAFDVAGDVLERRWERSYFDTDAGAGPEETAAGGLGVFTTDGDVLVGYAGSELLALDFATGEERWRVDPDGFRNTPTPPTVVRGVVYDTVFGGAPLLAFSGVDGSLVREWSADEIFPSGDDAGGRGVYGPVIGDRIVVEGTDADVQLVVAFVPLV